MVYTAQESYLHIKGVWQIKGIGSNSPSFTNAPMPSEQAGSDNDMLFVCVGTDSAQTHAIGVLAATVYNSLQASVEAKTTEACAKTMAHHFCRDFNLQAAPLEKLPAPLRSAKNLWAFTPKTLAFA